MNKYLDKCILNIYVYKELFCGENYIGQKGTKLADCVRVHKQQIREPSVRNNPYSEHFDVCGRGRFEIFLFYKVRVESDQLRLAKGQYFINKFKRKLNR